MGKKNNKGLIIILIIIIVLLLCLVGYLLFGNKIMNNKSDNDTTSTTTTNNKNLNNILDIFNQTVDLKASNITPEISDDILKTIFDSLDKSINNNKIIVSCIDYVEKDVEPEQYGCWETKVEVNDTFSYTNYGDGCSSSGKLYTYDNYLIHIQYDDGCISSGKVAIYNNNNNIMVFSNEKMYYTVFKDESSIYVNPIIVNGKLYFMEATDDDNKMNLISIDLTKEVIKASIEKIVDVSHGGYKS